MSITYWYWRFFLGEIHSHIIQTYTYNENTHSLLLKNYANFTKNLKMKTP